MAKTKFKNFLDKIIPLERAAGNFQAPLLPAMANVPDELAKYINYSEFKQILNRIKSHQKRTGARSISILSMTAHEGKSFIIGSLAMGYSKFLGENVLVIDTSTFGDQQSLPLNQILDPESEKIDDCGAMPTAFPRVHLIKLSECSFEKNASSPEYILKRIIEHYGNRFDTYLVDTCGIDKKNRANVDPLIIAHHCDATILVTSPLSQMSNAFQDIRNAVEQGEIKLLGLIENFKLSPRANP